MNAKSVDQFVSTPAKILSRIGQNIGKIFLTLKKAVHSSQDPGRTNKTGENHVSVNLVNAPADQQQSRSAAKVKTTVDQMSPKYSSENDRAKVSCLVTGDLAAIRKMASAATDKSTIFRSPPPGTGRDRDNQS